MGRGLGRGLGRGMGLGWGRGWDEAELQPAAVRTARRFSVFSSAASRCCTCLRPGLR